MPLILDPESTFEVVLDYDKKKDKENQPVFVFEYLSARQWKKLAELNDKFFSFTKEKADDALDVPFEAIRLTIAGWQNLKDPEGEPIDFDTEKLEDILTTAEAIELMIAATQQTPNIEDKKKLDSPSDSSTKQSAKTVAGQQIAKEK